MINFFICRKHLIISVFLFWRYWLLIYPCNFWDISLFCRIFICVYWMTIPYNWVFPLMLMAISDITIVMECYCCVCLFFVWIMIVICFLLHLYCLSLLVFILLTDSYCYCYWFWYVFMSFLVRDNVWLNVATNFLLF